MRPKTTSARGCGRGCDNDDDDDDDDVMVDGPRRRPRRWVNGVPDFRRHRRLTTKIIISLQRCK